MPVSTVSIDASRFVSTISSLIYIWLTFPPRLNGRGLLGKMDEEASDDFDSSGPRTVLSTQIVVDQFDVRARLMERTPVF